MILCRQIRKQDQEIADDLFGNTRPTETSATPVKSMSIQMEEMTIDQNQVFDFSDLKKFETFLDQVSNSMHKSKIWVYLFIFFFLNLI